jgi:hypothetical protein
VTTAPRILAGGRSFPCHPDRRVRFSNIVPVVRRCPLCGRKWQVRFTTALISTRMPEVVFRADWEGM